METIDNKVTIELDSGKDLVDIIVALLRMQTTTFVKDEALVDLTARMVIQASKIIDKDELAKLQNHE